MENEIMYQENNELLMKDGQELGDAVKPNSERLALAKLVDEAITAAKDDRMNTKRVISADIASAARVQNQYDKVICAYDRELRRKDLPEEQRIHLLHEMKEAASCSARIDQESRTFRQQQLEYSHKLPWKEITFAIGILVLGIAAQYKAA